MSSNKRLKFIKGKTCVKMFKRIKKYDLDSVKKIIIFALAEEVKESYDNLQIMLRPMNLHNIKFYCSVDLKVASLILGIQCATSTYPCIYCEKNKNKFGYMKETTNEELDPNDELNSESKSNFPIYIDYFIFNNLPVKCHIK